MFNFFKKTGEDAIKADNGSSTITPARELDYSATPTMQEQDFIDNTDPNGTSSHTTATINYGTNMPIDSIFAYIEMDWEEAGRQDALRNPDASYMQAKMKIIGETLKRRFELIRLRYNKDIRNYEAQLDNLKILGVSTGLVQLESHIETCKEHLKKIDEMEKKLRDQDPSLMTMNDSYQRGFIMGVTVAVNNLVQ